MYRGKYFTLDNFSGGMSPDIPQTQLQVNQATDVSNLIILPDGRGIRSRPGDTVFNSTAMNSGANVQGVGYFLQTDASEFLVAIAGAKIFKSDSLDGTMDDITDVYAGITAGQDNRWTLLTFNDTLIGFGGDKDSPDAPIKWTGTGNVAALGGSPPSAYGGLSANNRVFAYRTNAAPSTIFWTVLGDPEDWSGSGSGSAVIGSLDDNEKITGAVVISTNYMLVFKETSTHQIVISQAPFSVYSLFDKTGCVGKDAIVNVDGTVYFIAQNNRMYSTDGHGLTEYPGFGKHWNDLKSGEAPFIQGNRIKGKDYDWIVWLVRTSALNDDDGQAFVWDLLNKCWLRNIHGFSHNTAGVKNTGDVYYGSYDGKIYRPMQEGTWADNSESTTAITAYWRSGWLNPDIVSKILQVRKLEAIGQYKASGTVTIKYGFNGKQDQSTFTLDQTRPLTNAQYYHRGNTLTGRGNTMQFLIQGSSSAIDIEVHKLILAGKVYGQKEQEES
jgi:hypothetical protein